MPVLIDYNPLANEITTYPYYFYESIDDFSGMVSPSFSTLIIDTTDKSNINNKCEVFYSMISGVMVFDKLHNYIFNSNYYPNTQWAFYGLTYEDFAT